MFDRSFAGELSTQDADLLLRLNAYFDDLDQHVSKGHGWLIFSCAGERGARVRRLVLNRLALLRPLYSYYHVSWRDLALHSYVSNVALPQDASLVAEEESSSPRRQQYEIATSVAHATMYHLTTADVVVLTGVHPTHQHEAIALTDTAVRRAKVRRATIVLTPHDPWELPRAFNAADPSTRSWQQFFDAMVSASLIAV